MTSSVHQSPTIRMVSTGWCRSVSHPMGSCPRDEPKGGCSADNHWRAAGRRRSAVTAARQTPTPGDARAVGRPLDAVAVVPVAATPRATAPAAAVGPAQCPRQPHSVNFYAGGSWRCSHAETLARSQRRTHVMRSQGLPGRIPCEESVAAFAASEASAVHTHCLDFRTHCLDF